MLTPSQLANIFREYDFAPLKRFGENYLIDGNIKDKIIAESGVTGDDIVLEIGPGLGALTLDLAKTGAAVYAVEKDPKAFRILQDLSAGEFDNLHLFNEDILDFDLSRVPSTKKIKVLGNLPYYITTPITEILMREAKRIEFALIVIQREVAQRYIAKPGGKEYGSISCFVQYYTEPVNLYTIKRTSFYPEPDVDSALLRLNMRQSPPVVVQDEAIFFRIVRGAFNQRRKTILNSLARAEVIDVPKEKMESILRGAGIDPILRPEVIDLDGFGRITNAVQKALNPI